MESTDGIKKESPRDRILKTAIHFFNSKGIRATGVDTLIEESGVAKMTFYKYFPTKKALVMEYLRERDHFVLALLKERLSREGPSPREKLLSIFDVLKNLCEDPQFRGCVFINAIAESRSVESEEHLFSASHKRAFQQLLKETAIQAGLKKPNEVADQLSLLFHGAVVTAQIEDSTRPIQVARELAYKLV